MKKIKRKNLNKWKNFSIIIISIILIAVFVWAAAPTLTINAPKRFIPYHISGQNSSLNFTVDTDGSTVSLCNLQYQNKNYTLGNLCNITINKAGNFSLYGHTNILTVSGSESATQGVVMKNFVGIWVSGFNKTPDDASTLGMLKNISVGDENISTCTFSGNYCSFPSPVFFANNTQFAIAANGTSVSRARLSSAPWPSNTIYFKYNNSYIAGQLLHTDFYTIHGVNVSNTEPSTENRQRNISSYFNVTAYENRTAIIFVRDNSSQATINVTGWDYGIFENTQTFNTSVYEIDNEGFVIDINYSSTLYTSISADLYYNTTRSSGTKTGSGDHAKFTKTIFIPSIDSNTSKNILWAFYLTNTTGTFNYNSTPRTQYVAIINFSICGASPQNIPHIRFLFKNETSSEERTNATISSSWTYWTTSQTTNKTLTHSSTTELNNYTFCFSPPYKTINIDLDLDYDNGYSEQRTYRLNGQSLSNSTTETTLYLLPSQLGVFSTYQTIDNDGEIIEGVKVSITRNLGGSSKTMFVDVTDSSGRVTPFLNPDASYDFTFQKSGFDVVTKSLAPVGGDTVTIVLGGGGGAVSNSTLAGKNLSYEFLPENNTFNNDTAYDFGAIINGSKVTYAQFQLWNQTSNLTGKISRNSEGILTTNFNTGNHTLLIGYLLITNNNENITITKIWTKGSYIGEYSFYRQFTLWHDYGFGSGIRIFIILCTIILATAFVSRGEVIDSSESKMVIITIIVWIFSVVGWLDLGLSNYFQTEDNGPLIKETTQYAGKYFIAILTTAGSTALVWRRFLRG